MWNSARFFCAVVMLLLPAAAIAGSERFDGKWITTLSCEPARGALGFSYQFVSEIKDGGFRGIHGIEGEPGSLLIEGQIAEDGTGQLYADGRTGSKEYVPGRETPPGTEFGYHIKAQFKDRTGAGTRVEGRPCTLEFKKK